MLGPSPTPGVVSGVGNEDGDVRRSARTAVPDEAFAVSRVRGLARSATAVDSEPRGRAVRRP